MGMRVGCRHNEKRLSALILDNLKFSQDFNIKVKDIATVDARGYVNHAATSVHREMYTSRCSYTYLAWAYACCHSDFDRAMREASDCRSGNRYRLSRFSYTLTPKANEGSPAANLFIMKRFFRISVICALLAMVAIPMSAKKITIVVIPETADIKVNGSNYGNSPAVVDVKKDDFVSIEITCPGYEDFNTRVYGSDKRKTIEYKLKKDTWTEVTTNSGIVNKFFSVAVDKNLYTVDESGRMNPEKAWKLIHSILLNYFDEIESTDMASGFIQTPWKYKNYVENRRALRSRVSIRQTGIDDELVFQIKIFSEEAPIEGRNRDEAYRPTSQIMKELEPLISEFQTRLGIVR